MYNIYSVLLTTRISTEVKSPVSVSAAPPTETRPGKCFFTFTGGQTMSWAKMISPFVQDYIPIIQIMFHCQLMFLV